MNGINRIGQKVICIAEIEILTSRGTVYPSEIGCAPEVDQVYTVSGFLPSGFDRGTTTPVPGISLIGVKCLRFRRFGDGEEWGDMGWPIPMFRPIEERKTDISDMVAFCLGNTVRETEPA